MQVLQVRARVETQNEKTSLLSTLQTIRLENSTLTALPFISCVCPTYGRISRLREALACFLAQDYAGPHELVILNSFPQQKLMADIPHVRIANLPIRPASLAACRNFAISTSTGEIIVIWDDDDLYLPHHLTVIGEAFAESGADWVRLNPVWYSEAWKIQKAFSTWINAVAFKRAAWDKVGRYARNLSVGEDQQLWSALSKECKGVTVELKPEEISAIYCWGNATHHISGEGWDQPGKVPAYERSRLELEARVKRGDEPTGNVVLEPKLTHDPVAMAKAYLSIPAPVVKKNSVALVELGRYGDIANILPIARHIADHYDKPHLVVSKQFAGILDGVSYIVPHVVDLRNDQLKDAIAIAKKNFKYVINCQIWGSDWPQTRTTQSFNRESWKQSGFGPQFNNHSEKWLPLFDRRNTEREVGLVRKLQATNKPLLLVNVTHSSSSPFDGKTLFESIHKRFGELFEIVDCGNLVLHRIYDVVGLMENAVALVSIDTALLHLAPAASVRIPIVALVNEKPWQGSEIRGWCIERIPYDKARENPDAVLDAIELAVNTSIAEPIKRSMVTSFPPERTIFHVCERHEEKDLPSMPRKQHAWKSWDELYQGKNVVPCHLWEPYPRNSKTTIKDRRSLPYLKDVLSVGINQARPEDIILFTNDDNVLHPELPDILRLHCSLWGCACAQRSEFRKPLPDLAQSPETIAAQGERHMGRDMFAFTKAWLESKWEELPDFILGASDWDLCLAAMMRLQWGIRSNRQNMEEQMWPCEIPWGYVLHRFHPPKWNAASNRDTAPSQIYNRRLFKEWAGKHLPELKFYWNNTI